MEQTKEKKHRLIGLYAFMIVLFTMPLGHAAMIIMEKTLGAGSLTLAAFILGLVGLILAIWGYYMKKDTPATFAGFFGALLLWTGWIEFTFVYYAHRYDVAPLIENGEVVTKPEYLILMSSVGFWAIVSVLYIFGTRTGCIFYSWIQKKLGIYKNTDTLHASVKNHSITTFMETNMLLWTSYLVLMFAYDNELLGDRHPVTAFIAFGSLVWSAYLFYKLMKIKQIGYAIRYAVPTVIIFWTFVEILGRWDLFREIWVEPMKYSTEMIIMVIVMAVFLIFLLRSKKTTNNNHQ